jgi:hypothetical protein
LDAVPALEMEHPADRAASGAANFGLTVSSPGVLDQCHAAANWAAATIIATIACFRAGAVAGRLGLHFFKVQQLTIDPQESTRGQHARYQ